MGCNICIEGLSQRNKSIHIPLIYLDWISNRVYKHDIRICMQDNLSSTKCNRQLHLEKCEEKSGNLSFTANKTCLYFTQNLANPQAQEQFHPLSTQIAIINNAPILMSNDPAVHMDNSFHYFGGDSSNYSLRASRADLLDFSKFSDKLTSDQLPVLNYHSQWSQLRIPF